MSLAEVLVTPTFTGTQAAIKKHLGPAAEKAGRNAGSKMGQSMAEGLKAETKGLEAEVTRLGQAVTAAQDKVTASRAKSEAAAEAERKALGDVRVAELKLNEMRENSRAKASQIAAAEERLSSARSKAAASTRARESAETNLTTATKNLGTAQSFAADASRDLETHMKRVSEESDRAERRFGRLGAIMNRSFRGRPLAEVARSIKEDTSRIDLDLHHMAQNVSKQGTKGGRAFTQAFIAVVGGLSAITPAAGAAGASLLAATGSVVTLAGSLKDLAGVSALAPAALITVGAGVGVLRAAFAGVGEALETATEAAQSFGRATSGANPRLAAMALEDAQRGIADAERNAADARVQSARRVEDAKLSLRDAERAEADAAEASAEAQVQAARRVGEARRSLKETIDDVAQAQKAASKAVEMAQRREVEAARGVVEAQQDLVEAKEKAQARVNEVGRASFDADRDAVDAALAYKKAVAAYNAAKADPASSADTLTQLDNNVAKAYAADVDAKQAVVDLRKEHEKAREEAKAGSEAVRKAEQKVTDARQAEADAVQARKDAQAEAIRVQEEGAQRIADAELAITDAVKDQDRARVDASKSAEQSARAVADAQRSVEDAAKQAERSQVDGARAIEQANRNLERVQLQQADAAESAASQADKAGEKAREAMDKLTPAAQAAVASLLGVYTGLGDIRRIAQENFFTGFTGPLERLAATVMPQLATGVGAVATAFGAGAQQLMTSLSNAFDGGVLDGLLTSVATVVTNLTPAIDPLVQAFVTLAAIGMPYMEDLATWISEAATEFNAFVQGAAADGSLKGFIDAGIQGFRDLGSILSSTAGIFGALADAARAGGIDTTLGSVADNMNRMEVAMQGSVFQGTMATIFEGAAAGARGLRDALAPIGEAFRTGAPALAEFLRLGGEIAGLFLGGVFTALSDPTWGSGLTTFLEGLQGGVQELVPLLPGLTGAFGDVLAAMAPIVRELGPSLVEVFSAFGEGIANLLTVLDPFLVAIADSPVVLGVLIGAFAATAAASALLTAAGNVQIIVVRAWQLATLAFRGAQLLLAGAQGAVTAATWLLTAAQNSNIAASVRAAAASVAQKIALVASTAATKAATAGQWLMNAALSANPIGIVIALIAGLVAGLVWFFTQTELGRTIIQNVWSAIKSFVAGFINWFRDVFLPGAVSVLLRLREGFQVAKDRIVGFMEDLKAGVDRRISKVKEFFVGLGTALSKVPDTFKDMVKGAMREFDKLKDKAKEPIVFLVDKVLNEGLIGTFNGLLSKVGAPEIPPFKLPAAIFGKGYRKGGYTGDGHLDEVAGPVHRKEFVFDAAATAAAGPERLAAMAHGLKTKGLHGLAASMGEGNMGGFFEGNAANVRRHGAYYLDVPSALAPWNFGGAAALWNGAAGVKVKVGKGNLQGRATPLERGGGILGYTTGNNIDMSPSWMARLAPKQRLTVAAHEIGHALGLPHNSLNSIMQPNLAQMAAVPTALDIRNLQRLFPGGSGKAGDPGDAGSDNPFDGLVGRLMSEFKKAFPAGGLFIDVAGGLAKLGLGQIVQWVSDIKEGIKNIAGNVVNSIKGFFGGGAATAPDELFRDQGGWLPPGVHRVRNDTGQHEAILNPQQWRDIRQVALAGGGGGVQHNWNIRAEPGLAQRYAQDIARQGEQRSRDMAAAYGTNRRRG